MLEMKLFSHSMFTKIGRSGIFRRGYAGLCTQGTRAPFCGQGIKMRSWFSTTSLRLTQEKDGKLPANVEAMFEASEKQKQDILRKYKDKIQKKTGEKIESVDDVQDYLKKEEIEISAEAEHKMASYFEKIQPGSQLPVGELKKTKKKMEDTEKKLAKKNPQVTKDPKKIEAIRAGDDQAASGAKVSGLL